MKHFLHNFNLWALALFVLFSSPRISNAQTIDLDFEKVPLTQALTTLGSQTGVDFIYAVRLVSRHNTTCTYAGTDTDAALDCLLKESNIFAKRLHARQYLLAPLRPASGAINAPDAYLPPLIQGRILDAVTGVALPGAHIYIPDIRRGTTSDRSGQFSFSQKQDTVYYAHVSYIGYKTAKSRLYPKTQPFTIYLQPIALEATTVLVEAQGDEEADLAAVPGLVALNIQDLDNVPSFGGEKDLFQTLQWTPGVHKAGVFNNDLLIRGGLADQNLYLLDGAPIYHPWHAFNLVSTFQTDSFDRIKLYRGSFPAQHGGRLASVLDARLKDGNRANPKTIASFSLLSGRFMIESPLTKRTSFMISGRRSYLDKVIGTEHPVQDASGRRDTLRTGYHFSDITSKLSFRPNRQHKLSFTFYSGGDELDLRLPFDLSLDFSSWLRPADLFFEVEHNWGNRLYSMQHQYVHTDRLLFTTTAYRTSYNATESELVRPTSSSLVQSRYHVRVKDIGVRTDIDFFLSSRHHMQGGYQVIGHTFNSSLISTLQRSESSTKYQDQTSDLTAFEVATYIQDNWQPNNKWLIQPGLRLSYFSGGQYTFLSPRLNVQYIVNPRYLILKGAIGRQVQYMQQLRDRYSFMYDLVSSRWIPTSDNIKPSTSVQTSLEAESQILPWLKLASEVYWRDSENILLPRDEFQTKDGIDGPGIEVASLLAQYTPGLARAYGMEFTGIIERGHWRWLLSYTGGRSKSKAPTLNESSFRPTRFDVPRAVKSAIIRQYTDWHLTLSTTIRSGYPITVPVAQYDLSGPGEDEPTQYLYRPQINNGRLPAYIRFDMSVGYRFDMLGAKWHTKFHLYNFTNKRNVIDRFYDPTGETVKIQNRKGLPILPLFELEMEL
ncbi:MAG: TonB-dependent receptor [Bacteroidota bacterium]